MRIPHTYPTIQNGANNFGHRHKTEKKRQGRLSEKSRAAARKI